MLVASLVGVLLGQNSSDLFPLSVSSGDPLIGPFGTKYEWHRVGQNYTPLLPGWTLIRTTKVATWVVCQRKGSDP